MLKKLERDALAADLAAVESLLASRTAEDDPIGHFQYSGRKAELQRRLSQLDEHYDRHSVG
jgi:hypothetical protein